MYVLILKIIDTIKHMSDVLDDNYICTNET
jgi:hypothetical protein